MTSMPPKTLKNVEDRLAATMDNIVQAEQNAKSLYIKAGHHLIDGGLLYAKAAGYKSFISFSTARGRGTSAPITTFCHPQNGMSFWQWAEAKICRSKSTAQLWMGWARRPDGYDESLNRSFKQNKIKNKTASYATRAIRIGIPTPPEIGKSEVTNPTMARRYRIDNAVAVLDALADDEYTEVMRRQKRAYRESQAAD